MNIARLNALYECRPETGELISRRTGASVGSVNGSGYLTTRIDSKQYYVHRVIFFMTHGTVPPLVDHINRNKLDNRISNLRCATAQQNQLNRTRQGRGVYRRGDKWIAQFGGRYIGIFQTECEALSARALAYGIGVSA